MNEESQSPEKDSATELDKKRRTVSKVKTIFKTKKCKFEFVYLKSGKKILRKTRYEHNNSSKVEIYKEAENPGIKQDDWEKCGTGYYKDGTKIRVYEHTDSQNYLTGWYKTEKVGKMCGPDGSFNHVIKVEYYYNKRVGVKQ